ncbi:MAG: hypothetical protein M9962_15730, partial [Oligoflexia bacterium]|nr:hypothetical protein [Oligoflexia bacterium]
NFFCRQPLIQSKVLFITKNQQNAIYTKPTARITAFDELINIDKITQIDSALKTATDLAVVPMQTQYGWEKKTIHIPISSLVSQETSRYLLARKLALGVPDTGDTMSSTKYKEWENYGLEAGVRVLQIEGIDPIYNNKLKSLIQKYKQRDGGIIHTLIFRPNSKNLNMSSAVLDNFEKTLEINFMPDLIRFAPTNSFSLTTSLLLYPLNEIHQNLLSNWTVLLRSLKRDLGFSNSWYRLPYNYFSQLDFWLYKISQVFFILFLVEIPFLFLTIKRKYLSYTYVFLTSILLLAKSIWMQNEL